MFLSVLLADVISVDSCFVLDVLFIFMGVFVFL